MKIAINKCFGGFEMSIKAIKRYLELINKGCYFYKQINKDKYIKCNSLGKRSVFELISTKDLGNTTKFIPDDCYFWEGDLARTDPILIQTIEELGEEASGSYSNIQIVNIPDNVKWEISNYDGNETIEEVHRSWQ